MDTELYKVFFLVLLVIASVGFGGWFILRSPNKNIVQLREATYVDTSILYKLDLEAIPPAIVHAAKVLGVDLSLVYLCADNPKLIGKPLDDDNMLLVITKYAFDVLTKTESLNRGDKPLLQWLYVPREALTHAD